MTLKRRLRIYLNCLYKLGAVRKYIEDGKNGFEQLKEYLQNRNNP